MDLSNLGGLADLAKQMQDAYAGGTDAMNQAGKEVRKDMDPDHEIKLDIQLSAKVEGHDYKVKAQVTFEIELQPVLDAAESGGGDLSSILDGLDVDLGDDKDAVMEQLGQPRAFGVVKKIDIDKLELHSEGGNVDAELNQDGTLLATISDGKMSINCESVFAFPSETDAYYAVPSGEQMQKHIVVDLEKIEKPVKFEWTEKEKDGLKVKGEISIAAL